MPKAPRTSSSSSAKCGRIDVVVGVVERTDGCVLIAKRQGDQHLAGLWEFPGGKVDLGEGLQSALIRELQEEVGLRLSEPKYLFRIDYDYPEKSVSLHIFSVVNFTGAAQGLEGQAVAWVSKTKLSEYSFPEANQPILDYLQDGCG